MSPLLLVLYSLPDALCQLFGVQRLDDALGLAAHEAGVVDDAGRTLYLAHQHEGSEKQADQDGCEKDGEKLDENYGAEVMNDAGRAAEPITLGDDEYFVLGDNRNRSDDSRYENVENLKREKIVGRAWVRIWPLDRICVVRHQ